MTIKKTPLADEHVRCGAKMVDFAGWWMPVQYRGLREEHQNVRQNVGLFDVSHMGEIRVRGPQALSSIEWWTTNDAAKLNDGEAQYTLFPNEWGGLVDDLIVYCLKKNQDYLLCVNASNTDKDFDWCVKNNRGAELSNESSKWAQIAIQGPKAPALLDDVFGAGIRELRPFTFKQDRFEGFEVIIAATGYTGEKGAEVFIEANGATALWQQLLDKGTKYQVEPIGLGARDTLRTEMKYSLYGHEIDDTTNPYMAGLGWVIKPAKKDFIAKALIVAAKEAGLKQTLVGFRMQDKGIPRQGYSLFSFDNREIGKVTSGTLSPTLNEPIGIGFIDVSLGSVGSEFFVDIRGRKAKAVVVKTPFVTTSLS
jgi:aminomethyltransferase